MSLVSHVQELQKKHQQLEATITDEQRRPSFDPARVSALKKEKLRLKEEITRLSGSLH